MAIRLSAFVVPIFLGWLAVRLVDGHFWRAEWPVAWVLQAIVVAVLVSVVAERATRRFLPLAFVLNQTLVFPDQAPSKFGAALRANNLGRIDQRIQEIKESPGDRSEQQAAIDGLSLVAALSTHDRFTRGHTERVRAHADLIAKELGLSPDDRARLAWGVLLHDIGKLTVPEEILNKKTPLTDAEWATLNEHPAASAQFLEPMSDWLGEWGLAAAEHHERWDGNGYPNGLSGTDISLAGRITAVADAYDVITSARSYKAPMSAEAARHELVRCAAGQFDPVVVRAMLQVSVGKKRNFGFWSWLTEMPTIARLLASLGTNSAGAVVAMAASVATVAAPIVDLVATDAPPTELAFVQDALEESPSTTALVGSDGATSTTTTTPSTSSSTTAERTVTTSTEVTGSTPSSLPAPTTPMASTTTASPTSTASPTPTTTTTTTTTTTPPGAPVSLYLKNPGAAMETNAQPVLPLELEAPLAASVGNFDADRNDDPGITVKKDGAGFGQSDPDKVQYWEYTFSDATTLSGNTQLELYMAAKGFDPDKTLGVAARIYICEPTCSPLVSTTWTSSATPTWKQATLGFGSVSHTVNAGDVLQIRMIATDALATDDMMFAYDSIPQASVLRIG